LKRSTVFTKIFLYNYRNILSIKISLLKMVIMIVK